MEEQSLFPIIRTRLNSTNTKIKTDQWAGIPRIFGNSWLIFEDCQSTMYPFINEIPSLRHLPSREQWRIAKPYWLRVYAKYLLRMLLVLAALDSICIIIEILCGRWTFLWIFQCDLIGLFLTQFVFYRPILRDVDALILKDRQSGRLRQ